MHCVILVAPVVAENVPAGHNVVLKLAAGQYEPANTITRTRCGSAPAGHKSQDTLPPAPANLPAEQGGQKNWPVTADAVPGEQSEQAALLVWPSEGFDLPAAQSTQAEAAREGLNLPGGQAMHEPSEPCATEGWYVPTGQLVHAVAAIAEKVPTGQFVQTAGVMAAD